MNCHIKPAVTEVHSSLYKLTNVNRDAIDQILGDGMVRRELQVLADMWADLGVH